MPTQKTLGFARPRLAEVVSEARGPRPLLPASALVLYRNWEAGFGQFMVDSMCGMHSTKKNDVIRDDDYQPQATAKVKNRTQP